MNRDRLIVRDLAKRIKEISLLEVQEQQKENWRNLNNLQAKQILLYVWEEELPWQELSSYDEMKIRSERKFYRQQEYKLRKMLFMWNNFRGDMVVEDSLAFQPIYKDSMFGICEKGNHVFYSNHVQYYRYINQLEKPCDIDKIMIPSISYSQKENDEYKALLDDLYDDILDVKIGITRHNFSAWHFVIKFLGAEKFYYLLAKDKSFLHMIIKKMQQCYFARLKQFEDNGLILNNNGNYVVGSGGLSFIDNILGEKNANVWGSATAQVFHDVSPKLQEELAIDYENQWLDKFAYTYYGCCEDLSYKINELRKIKNLRKISVSPWADLERIVDEIQNEYVISFKINPALFVLPRWDIKEQRLFLRKQLRILKDHNVEIIIKDNSTLCNQKERLVQWLKMAKEEIMNI